MSLLTTLLGPVSGGGGGSPGIIIAPVTAASTTALTVTYANGAGGIGATLTNAGAQAIFSLDGISPIVGQRVLIKDQASQLQNGVYTVTVVGTIATNWILTRATDFDEPAEITPGVIVEVVSGTVNASTLWQQTATVTTVGTDAITFSDLTDVGLTASRAMVTDANGKVAVATTTSTEIGYVNGVTSAIQTQLDSKLAIGAVNQNSTPATLVVNTSYVANNAGLTTFNMPATVAQGSIFQIVGQGAGGWLVQMNTGQTANASGGSTSSAGSLASTNRYDCIRLICTVANTTFTVMNSSGVITNA